MLKILEAIIGVAILLILGIFLNPTNLLMPDSVNTMLILGLIVVFLAFASMVYKENAKDEREENHIQKSGRLAFLAGILTLVVGIVIQALRHEIDPWLIYGLSVMVLTKLITRVYSRLKN